MPPASQCPSGPFRHGSRCKCHGFLCGAVWRARALWRVLAGAGPDRGPGRGRNRSRGRRREYLRRLKGGTFLGGGWGGCWILGGVITGLGGRVLGVEV